MGQDSEQKHDYERAHGHVVLVMRAHALGMLWSSRVLCMVVTRAREHVVIVTRAHAHVCGHVGSIWWLKWWVFELLELLVSRAGDTSLWLEGGALRGSSC